MEWEVAVKIATNLCCRFQVSGLKVMFAELCYLCCDNRLISIYPNSKMANSQLTPYESSLYRAESEKHAEQTHEIQKNTIFSQFTPYMPIFCEKKAKNRRNKCHFFEGFYKFSLSPTMCEFPKKGKKTLIFNFHKSSIYADILRKKK